jgi:hypothetical protein
MLVEAIYDNGRLLFPKQYHFIHDRFCIKVDLPDAEIVEKNVATRTQELVAPSIDNGVTTDKASFLISASEYPAEYLEFKKLQDAIFGKDYVYVQEATDQELMQQHWLGKHA